MSAACWWIGCCEGVLAACVGDIFSLAVNSDVQRVLCGRGAGCDAVVVRRTTLSILPSIQISFQFPEPCL